MTPNEIIGLGLIAPVVIRAVLSLIPRYRYGSLEVGVALLLLAILGAAIYSTPSL